MQLRIGINPPAGGHRRTDYGDNTDDCLYLGERSSPFLLNLIYRINEWNESTKDNESTNGIHSYIRSYSLIRLNS